MSQEKVNKYKAEKANRKEIMKKEKRNKMIARLAGSVIGLALVAWIGYSAYDSIAEAIYTSQVEVDFSAIDDYLEVLYAEEEDAEEDKNDDTSSDDTNGSEDNSESDTTEE